MRHCRHQRFDHDVDHGIVGGGRYRNRRARADRAEREAALLMAEMAAGELTVGTQNGTATQADLSPGRLTA